VAEAHGDKNKVKSYLRIVYDSKRETKQRRRKEKYVRREGHDQRGKWVKRARQEN